MVIAWVLRVVPMQVAAQTGDQRKRHSTRSGGSGCESRPAIGNATAPLAPRLGQSELASCATDAHDQVLGRTPRSTRDTTTPSSNAGSVRPSPVSLCRRARRSSHRCWLRRWRGLLPPLLGLAPTTRCPRGECLLPSRTARSRGRPRVSAVIPERNAVCRSGCRRPHHETRSVKALRFCSGSFASARASSGL